MFETEKICYGYPVQHYLLYIKAGRGEGGTGVNCFLGPERNKYVEVNLGKKRWYPWHLGMKTS